MLVVDLAGEAKVAVYVAKKHHTGEGRDKLAGVCEQRGDQCRRVLQPLVCSTAYGCTPDDLKFR